MARKTKEQIRAEWMGNFEAALRTVCDERDLEFPAGRIDWNSPTYHYLSGHSFTDAAVSYAENYCEKE